MERKAKLVAWAIAFENVREARRRFLVEFNEEAPCESTIHRWVGRFLEYGDINHRREGSGRRRTSCSDVSFETLNARIQAEPTVSTRQLSRDSGIPQSSIVRCLKEHNFHPFKFTQVQQLSEDDYDRRMEFCQWVVDKQHDQADFHHQILFSDEAVFHVNGVVNRHNLHYWSQENPHEKMEKFQNRESVTIWCMVSDSGIESFNISFETMNSDRYCQILENKVIPYFQRPENQRKFFQQDGAPPHFSLAARDLLNHHLPRRWIGRRGYTEWPPRSPDLTVCDFFLWGTLRDKVFIHRPRTRQQLAKTIEEEIGRFTDAEMFNNSYRSFLDRCHKCVEKGGAQFE